jgi:hypothetical protein
MLFRRWAILLARLGEDLVLAWPEPSAGYILESTPPSTANSTRMPVILPAVGTNGQNQVTLPPSGEAQLFRLRKP